MPRFYAGIGARATPPEILNLMTRAAFALTKRGYVLRSGHAIGADSAFERGAGRERSRRKRDERCTRRGGHAHDHAARLGDHAPLGHGMLHSRAGVRWNCSRDPSNPSKTTGSSGRACSGYG